MGQIIIAGMNPAGKVPAALFNVNVGQGRVTPGNLPRYCLIVGNKLSGGSATVDQDVLDITPSTDVHALFDKRSEIAQMIRVARMYPGVRIKALAIAEAASSPASAVMTITFATNASSNGTWRFWVCDEYVEINVANADTPTAQAAALVTAINNARQGTLPCTAGNSSGVVTVTISQKGIRGNDWIVYKDESLKPTGTTCVLASSSSYTVNPGKGGVTGVRFGDGAGTDSNANAITVLANETYFTIASAQNDTTNGTRWKTALTTKAAIGSQKYEHLVMGSNGLYATAATLATTENFERFRAPWMRGCESHPAVLAASVAALMTQKDQVHPNQSYNGAELLGISPQRAPLDLPGDGETGEQQIALENGVTPVTTRDGVAKIVRLITTRCLLNSVPNYKCIDNGQARTPDVAAEAVKLAWDTDFVVSNPWVGPDPAEGEKTPEQGKAYPRLWTSYAQGILSAKISANWFESVTITSEYDNDGKQILTQIDLEITALDHRIGGNINQVVS